MSMTRTMALVVFTVALCGVSPANSADDSSKADAKVIISSAPEGAGEIDLSFLTESQRDFVRRLMVIPRQQRHGAFCVAPGTSQEYIDLLDRLMYPDVDGSLRYELATRWPGAQGSPLSLTYSFVPDGVSVPADVGMPGGSNQLNSLFDGLFGSTAAWQNIFFESFDAWGSISGLDHSVVSDDGAPLFGSAGSGSRGDVRISAIPLDGFNGVLAYNHFPTAQFGSSGGGDMVFDADDGPNWGNSANGYRFLRNTVMHEHGHGMGLMHVCPDNGTKLMEPAINTSFVGPQLDDTRAVQRHYGDVFEPNDSVGTVADLGGFFNRTEVYNDLSIDDNSDVDVYVFTTGGNAIFSGSVTPIGTTYQSAAQGFLGCFFTNPVNVNALTMHNLNLTLLDTDGVTVLATASSNPSGQAESINGFALSGGGFYYVRVSTASSTNDVQLYDLDISVTLPAGNGDFDGDGDVDLLDFAGFQSCQGPVGVGCDVFDFNTDGNVDSADVAGFVGALTGP